VCQLGRSSQIVHEVPEAKALKAFKMVIRYGGGGFGALAFGNIQFERLRKGKFVQFTNQYHRGGTFRTVAPDVDPYQAIGNARGFWAWRHKETGVQRGGYWRVMFEVRMWGKVVKHKLGYRAEYIKFVKKVTK
jgi:hypothetical protein